MYMCVCRGGICVCMLYSSGLPWWLSGKESACNARNAGDSSSVPDSRRFPGGGHGNHSRILAWRILWTEEPGGLLAIELKRV